jgi:DNA (cytosine-5)-methyltransferase 1
MDVGFENAGFTVLAANEQDHVASETFRSNHPNTDLFEGPIEEHSSVLSSYRDIDVIFGGPPCQGFSVAGKMKVYDPRSQLIFSFAQIIENVRPQAFVMENVKTLATLPNFLDIRTAFINRLSKAGYVLSIHILNARDFGVSQSRERVFFIGVKKGLTSPNSFYFERYRKKSPTLREVIKPFGRAGSETNLRTCQAKITLATKPILRKSAYAGMLFNGQGRPMNPDSWSSTLTASMGGNRTPIIDEEHLYNYSSSWVENYHQHLMNGGQPYSTNEVPEYLRRLTVDEAASLQSFPDKYVFCGVQSKVFSQIGNAVPCKLAEVVARVVRSSLENDQALLNDNVFKKNIQLELIY